MHAVSFCNLILLVSFTKSILNNLIKKKGDFETAETVNSNLGSALHELVSTPFFRFHKVSDNTIYNIQKVKKERK